MGFFSRLLGKREGGHEQGGGAQSGKRKYTGHLGRLRKRVTNKYGQPQERQAAIHSVAEMGTEEAAEVLLERFTFSIEQSITDEEEKRTVCDYLIGFGDVAVPAILRYLENENAPYWAIKALRSIIGDEATVDHLVAIIDRTEAIFDRDVERKVLLVSNLRELNHPKVKEKLVSFLDDENEELRVQAVEGLSNMLDGEMAELLVERLVDSSETQRLKTAILNVLVDRKVKVKRRREDVRKAIPQSFWIDDVGVIRRREFQ